MIPREIRKKAIHRRITRKQLKGDKAAWQALKARGFVYSVGDKISETEGKLSWLLADGKRCGLVVYTGRERKDYPKAWAEAISWDFWKDDHPRYRFIIVMEVLWHFHGGQWNEGREIKVEKDS